MLRLRLRWVLVDIFTFGGHSHRLRLVDVVRGLCGQSNVIRHSNSGDQPPIIDNDQILKVRLAMGTTPAVLGGRGAEKTASRLFFNDRPVTGEATRVDLSPRQMRHPRVDDTVTLLVASLDLCLSFSFFPVFPARTQFLLVNLGNTLHALLGCVIIHDDHDNAHNACNRPHLGGGDPAERRRRQRVHHDRGQGVLPKTSCSSALAIDN